jgi:hypothetical protein
MEIPSSRRAGQIKEKKCQPQTRETFFLCPPRPNLNPKTHTTHTHLESSKHHAAVPVARGIDRGDHRRRLRSAAHGTSSKWIMGRYRLGKCEDYPACAPWRQTSGGGGGSLFPLRYYSDIIRCVCLFFCASETSMAPHNRVFLDFHFAASPVRSPRIQNKVGIGTGRGRVVAGVGDGVRVRGGCDREAHRRVWLHSLRGKATR